jgi:hypothetical protein
MSLDTVTEGGVVCSSTQERSEADTVLPPARSFLDDCFVSTCEARTAILQLLTKRRLEDYEMSFIKCTIGLLNKVENAHLLLHYHKPGCGALRRVSDFSYSAHLMFSTSIILEAASLVRCLEHYEKRRSVEELEGFMRRDGCMCMEHTETEFVLRVLGDTTCCTRG